MTTIPLQDQVAEYLEEVARRRSPATAYLYRSVLERIFLPWAVSENVATAVEMNDKAMDNFTAYLQRKEQSGYRHKPLSKESIRSYIRAVRTFLGWAEVPKGKYEAPRSPQRLRDVLSRQEIQLMEETATDERDRLIVRVLADTGIRVGELLGLRPQDLRENTNNRKCSIWVIGKGDKEREVAIPTVVFRRLKHHADQNRTEHIFTGKRRRPEWSDRSSYYLRRRPTGLENPTPKLAGVGSIHIR